MSLSDEERASNYYVKTGALRNSSGKSPHRGEI